MQEKVSFYIKSHYLGLLTSVLVLLALFLGYSWGMSNYRSNVNNGGTFIEKVLDSKNASSTTMDNGQTDNQTIKNGAPVTNSPTDSKTKSIIIDSDNIRPIPKDTKPADRPLYFFY
jgi:hypothetical protein